MPGLPGELDGGAHSPCLLCRLEDTGVHVFVGSAPDTDPKEAWLSGSTRKVSSFSHFMPRSHGRKFSQAMCGKQGSQSDSWARKSQ